MIPDIPCRILATAFRAPVRHSLLLGKSPWSRTGAQRIEALTYLHIHIPNLTKEAFLHASREQLGTWLLLYAYCATQENGGRIRNCGNWAPASWYAIIRSDRPGESPIWLWHDEDLLIVGYDMDNQKRAQKMRKGGKLGAKRRWNISPNLPKSLE